MFNKKGTSGASSTSNISAYLSQPLLLLKLENHSKNIPTIARTAGKIAA